MAEKMTKKEMYDVIIAAMADNEDVVAFCENEKALLDKKAVKAKERAAIKREAADELRERVAGVLNTETAMTIPEVVAALGDEEVTAAKVTYRLNALADAGLVEKTEVPATNGTKSHKVKAFRLIG